MSFLKEQNAPRSLASTYSRASFRTCILCRGRGDLTQRNRKRVGDMPSTTSDEAVSLLPLYVVSSPDRRIVHAHEILLSRVGATSERCQVTTDRFP